MATKTGTTISCDRYECKHDVFEPTVEAAREWAARLGWTQTEDGRDFCRFCTELRAARKSPADLAPEGSVVMTAFEAAEAAGWERRLFDEDTGEAHFFCCGVEVDVNSFIGVPTFAECQACKTAIGSVLSPSFGNASVAFIDSDKVDTEDPRSWIVRRAEPYPRST